MIDMLHIVLAIYALIVFCVALFRPKIGLFMMVPLVGLGFSDSYLVKGGIEGIFVIAVVGNACMTGRKYVMSRAVLSITLLVLSVVAWVLLRAVMTGDGLRLWVPWIASRLFAPGLFAALAVFLLRTKKDLYAFFWVLFGFAVCTATVGLLQYYPGWDIFWHMREVLGVPASISYQIVDRMRIVGLSSYVIPLSYQMLSVFPIALSIIISRNRLRHRIPLFLLTGLILVALLLSFMKAAIGGAVLGAIVVILLIVASKTARRRSLIAVTGAFLIITSCILVFTPAPTKIFVLGASGSERIPLALAGAKVLHRYPFGAGYHYNERVKDIYAEISYLPRAKAALVLFPHNLFLSIGVMIGLPAFVLIAGFYWKLFVELFRVIRRTSGEVKILAIGLIGSFTAYLFNTMFHNNNPFFGDAFNWLFIGLTLALINVVALEKEEIVEAST